MLLPFKPASIAARPAYTHRSQALEYVPSVTESLLSIAEEKDLFFDGLLCVWPLSTMDWVSLYEEETGRKLNRSYLKLTLPLTVGHGLLFEQESYTSIDYRVAVCNKGEAVPFLHWMGTAAFLSEGNMLRVRHQLVTVTDSLQQIGLGAVYPVIRIPAVVVEHEAGVLAYVATSKLGLTFGKLHNLPNEEADKLIEFKDNFTEGLSDVYQTRKFRPHEAGFEAVPRADKLSEDG